jgi:FAD-dependent urate hydroxylase
MKAGMRIAIIGYGTAGQALAVALSRDGHRVDVFERVPVPGPVGAGFLLQPTGLSVLWQLGLLDATLQYGAVVRRLYGETTAARVVMDMRYRELHPALFGVGLQRGALFEMLDAAWTQDRRIHCGCEIVRIDHDRGVLHDGQGDEHGPFDLVVVADGSASALRAQIGQIVFDRPYPWGAQWCLVPAGDWLWHDELRQRYRHARRMVGMLPVGTRPGDTTPRLSFFWSLPATALAQAGHDEARWRAEVAEIWPDAAQRLLATQVPEGLAQARYRDTVVRHWHRGRAVLIGDAAHAMSPQLGQGVNMALADALALRDVLRTASTLPEALDAYQRLRRRHLGIYHFWSRWLTPLFQSDRDRIATLRDLLFHPLSRVPGGRGQSLRILTGTRSGWFGRWSLPVPFIEALVRAGE